MLFNTITFAIFLPIVFAIYWGLLREKIRWQNLFLLIASYVFYASWDWRFLILIILSSFCDYTIGLKLHSSTTQTNRKRWLGLSLLINLGVLGIFKYFNFFIQSFAQLLEQFSLHADVPTLSIILPVGISFYTFQTLSYTIDIYRKELQPTHSPLDFFAFVAFFPQLVAGPIERASHLLPQFSKARQFDYTLAASGGRLILWGLFKKVVIADNIAPIVDTMYAHPSEYTGLMVLFAGALFGVQIYCDFSGYSDIAIGVARWFGFDLKTNFRTPYFSSSIREFWNRWHISLSTWFRDYVYIPLGGNRVPIARWMFNLFVTFLVSGLWHGANFTYIAWGAIHGVAICIVSLGRHFKFWGNFPRWLGVPLTFLVVSIAWIFFRAKTLADAMTFMDNLFIFDNQGNILGLFESNLDALYISLSFLLFLIVELIIGKKDINVIAAWSKPQRWLFYYGLITWFFLFGEFDATPNFIYFQF